MTEMLNTRQQHPPEDIWASLGEGSPSGWALFAALKDCATPPPQPRLLEGGRGLGKPASASI